MLCVYNTKKQKRWSDYPLTLVWPDKLKKSTAAHIQDTALTDEELVVKKEFSWNVKSGIWSCAGLLWVREEKSITLILNLDKEMATDQGRFILTFVFMPTVPQCGHFGVLLQKAKAEPKSKPLKHKKNQQKHIHDWSVHFFQFLSISLFFRSAFASSKPDSFQASTSNLLLKSQCLDRQEGPESRKETTRSLMR